VGVVVQAVFVGMVIVIAGTIPRNTLFAANLRYYPRLPWAIPVTAAYLWLFWRYLGGLGPPASTSQARRLGLRANRVPVRLWTWALVAGGLGIVALILGLRVVNRMIALPEQRLPDLAAVPQFTVLALLLMAAPVAGIIEEAAFRGYMQGPIEERYGLVVAILITGTMFAVAHLDFTPILWPYYVAVSAIYGIVTHHTRSVLPAVVLHTGGNVYSNLDLWLHGQAEWQKSGEAAGLIWEAGPDASFALTLAAFLVVLSASVWSYVKLADAARGASDYVTRKTSGSVSSTMLRR
jgi:membrane protease YdiL (CAAX protease family)